MYIEKPKQLSKDENISTNNLTTGKKLATTLEDFEIINKIGKGYFGTVYKVRRKADNNIYALKQISISHLNQQTRNSAINEVQILASLRNPYIVKYYESFIDRTYLNIIMEYCENGDLDTFIKRHVNRSIPEKKIWKIMIQVLIGLHYINKKNVIHRDLKTMNIFLTKDEDIRIGDMGLAKVLDYAGKTAHGVVGSPYFISPEICERKPYNEKTDIWSLGCILHELCTLRHTFEATSEAALLVKIVKSMHKPIPEHYSRELEEIINGCLCKDPQMRYSTLNLLSMKVVMQKAKSFDIDLEVIIGADLKSAEKKLEDNTPLKISKTGSQGFAEEAQALAEREEDNSAPTPRHIKKKVTFATPRNSKEGIQQKGLNFHSSSDLAIKENLSDKAVSPSNALFKLYFENKQNANDTQKSKDAPELKFLAGVKSTLETKAGQAENTEVMSSGKSSGFKALASLAIARANSDEPEKTPKPGIGAVKTTQTSHLTNRQSLPDHLQMFSSTARLSEKSQIRNTTIFNKERPLVDSLSPSEKQSAFNSTASTLRLPSLQSNTLQKHRSHNNKSVDQFYESGSQTPKVSSLAQSQRLPHKEDNNKINHLRFSETYSTFDKRITPLSNYGAEGPKNGDGSTFRKNKKPIEQAGLVSPLVAKRKRIQMTSVPKLERDLDEMLPEREFSTARLSAGSALKDSTHAMKRSQLQQLYDEGTIECKDILGEQKFRNAMGYFREKLKGSQKITEESQKETTEFISKHLRGIPNFDKGISMIYRLLRQEMELERLNGAANIQ